MGYDTRIYKSASLYLIDLDNFNQTFLISCNANSALRMMRRTGFVTIDCIDSRVQVEGKTFPPRHIHHMPSPRSQYVHYPLFWIQR